MGLKGKLVGQIEIKSDGDVFHEIFRHRPHHISDMSPDKIQGVDLHDGEWGAVGSVVFWNYTHEDTAEGVKCLVEAIDEENKSVTFSVVDGDIAKLCKTFKATVDVDTKGENNVVTWTIEYEKLNEDVPEPISYLQFALNVTRDIEAHHLK
ncbi:hypothetical protein M9H77_07544 [Catharanthus roseus]|uniref:Uncharacterized protein n=1 Tax=Catharanthus roseus TaxID=4058 RepID=A0ACC0BV85_CATRO|nr:hypothetical protein M9H77_07544 [Catharanthus roseus]